MADVLIRDVPERVIAVIDERARRLGLSRNEYLRRQLAAVSTGATVTRADLARFGETFADLTDGEVMARAWQ